MEGVAVPLTKPAFFQSDRLPRWRSALLGGWIWLRLRRRHNPGFVTAAAAGSIGLLLTLLLLLNGGFGLGGADKNSEPEVATETDLGAPSDTPPEESRTIAGVSRTGFDGDGAGVGGVTGKAMHSERADDDAGILIGTRGGKPANASGRAISKRDRPAFEDEQLTSQEEPESNAPPATMPEKAVATRALPPKVEEKEEEEDAKSEDDRGFLPEDDPLTRRDDDKPADESPLARTKPAVGAIPLLADDNATEEPADDPKDDVKLVEDEPQKSQPQATTVVTAAPKSDKLAEDAPIGGDDPFLQPKSRSSWKDSKAKPLPPVKEPIAAEPTQSRAVETAVYATTPEPQEATPRPTQARPPAEPSTLALEIRAPKNITPGQTFDLEFVVTNTSRQAVEGASLSVALPPGLVHPQGPDLEQPIVSIAGCQQYRGRMKVKAVGTGELSPRADVSVRGKTGAQSTITLRVGDTSRQVRSSPFDPCACEPIRPVR